ncbi:MULTISPECIES: hypothetical protein [unclassified Streptomyces]|uniref:hypothetical protein n=1 Tax=unclassified Streptomyces TaxID=2593676 RepID=UPI0033E70655
MRKRKPTPRRTTSAPPDNSPRRDAATHLLRGTCYGLGTSLAGLAAWWLQHHG